MNKERGSGRANRASAAAIRGELELLDVLNTAAFNVLFNDIKTQDGLIDVAVDRTSPKRDRCRASKLSQRGLQGDFCLARWWSDAMFVVVGDAFGHFSYALGLKIVVAMCLDRIFAKSEIRPPANPIDIVRELMQFFCRLDEADTGTTGLLGGADMVVMRLDPASRVMSYASAGLPFYLLRRDDILQYGDFSPQKTVGFPSSYVGDGPAAPIVGEVDLSELTDPAFLAVVTDGFEDLRRALDADATTEAASVEQFGRKSVEQALLTGAGKACEARSRKYQPAETIARTLVKAARHFRRGYSIPEEFEDGRQVVVVDLKKLWAGGAGDRVDV